MDCLFWNKSIDKDGYGEIQILGRHHKAHRLAYLVFEAIPKGFVVRHLCFNKSCVNPFHLEACPEYLNKQDADVAKLTPEQVAEIKERKEPTVELAKEYKISKTTIGDIKKGRTWSNIRPDLTVVRVVEREIEYKTKEQWKSYFRAFFIHWLYEKTNLSMRQIGNKLGITRGSVSRILSGTRQPLAYKHYMSNKSMLS